MQYLRIISYVLTTTTPPHSPPPPLTTPSSHNPPSPTPSQHTDALYTRSHACTLEQTIHRNVEPGVAIICPDPHRSRPIVRLHRVNIRDFPNPNPSPNPFFEYCNHRWWWWWWWWLSVYYIIVYPMIVCFNITHPLNLPLSYPPLSPTPPPPPPSPPPLSTPPSPSSDITVPKY